MFKNRGKIVEDNVYFLNYTFYFQNFDTEYALSGN